MVVSTLKEKVFQTKSASFQHPRHVLWEPCTLKVSVRLGWPVGEQCPSDQKSIKILTQFCGVGGGSNYVSSGDGLRAKGRSQIRNVNEGTRVCACVHRRERLRLSRVNATEWD